MTKADEAAALELVRETAKQTGGRIPNSFFQAVGQRAQDLASEWEMNGLIIPVGPSNSAFLGTVYRLAGGAR